VRAPEQAPATKSADRPSNDDGADRTIADGRRSAPAFGTGGPVYMVFLSARIHDKAALRATSSVVVMVSVWIRIVVFIGTGLLLHSPLLLTAALMAPVMVAGLALGNRLHDALSGRGVLRLIALLLVGNGISLVVRALPWLLVA